MSFAVIKTGGKQYLVSEGDKIKIEKLEMPPFAPAKDSAGKKAAKGKEEGKKVVFDEVLLVEKDDKVSLGTPFVKGAKVEAKVLRQDKRKKVTIFKQKSKKRYSKKTGHRQPFTEVEILKISNI